MSIPSLGLFLGFALILSGCVTQTTVTGKVVDARGQPVSQALVTAGFRGTHSVSPDVERVYIQTTTTEANGTFSFVTKESVGDLALRADSPDLKRSAVLRHIVQTGNLLVVR